MRRIGDQSKLDSGLRHSFHCFNDLGRLGIGNQILLMMISFLSLQSTSDDIIFTFPNQHTMPRKLFLALKFKV